MKNSKVTNQAANKVESVNALADIAKLNIETSVDHTLTLNSAIALCSKYVTSGKNASIVKAFLQGKTPKSIVMLQQLGYDFTPLNIAAACSTSQRKNYLNKLEKLIVQDSLHNIVTLFNALVKTPSAKQAQRIIDLLNSKECVKYRIREKLDAEVIALVTELSEGLCLSLFAERAPMWLSVNIGINGQVIEAVTPVTAEAEAEAEASASAEAEAEDIHTKITAFAQTINKSEYTVEQVIAMLQAELLALQVA